MQHKSVRVSRSAKAVSAGALASLLLASGAAADVVTSTWTANGDGSHWTDPANWSTDPQFPNDGGGHGYIARIDRDPGTPYTVLLDASVFIDGVTLNSPRATLQQTAGTLSLNLGGTIDLQAGTYQLVSGTIAGGRIQSEGGTLTVPNRVGLAAGTLDSVTLAAPIQVTRGNGLLLKNTLTLDGGSITLVDTGSQGTAPLGVYGSGDLTIGGTGSLVFGGTGGFNGVIGCAPGRTLTIGPNVTVTTSTAGGTLGAGRYIDGTTGTGTLINQGTINVPTNSLAIAGSWVNQGAMNVSAAQLTLAGSGSNPGTINLSGGTLMYTGAFSTANIVHLNRTGGQLWFNGTVDNAGQTLDLNRLGSIWLQGSLSGGTLRSDGAAELMVTGNASALSNLTLAGNVRFSAAGNTPALSNITMAGHDLIIEATNGDVDLSKISGNGRIVIAGVPNSSGVTSRITGPLGPSFSLITDTAASSGVGVGIYDGANSGAIVAQSPKIALQLEGAWSNPNGHIAAINGGVLFVNSFPGSFGDFSVTSAEVDLRVPLTTAQLRGITASGATFGIDNTLTNTNDTFALTGNESIKISGKVIDGAITGTSTDRAYIRDNANATLQNLALGVPLTIQHDAFLNADHLTLNGTSITLESGQSRATSMNGTVLGSGEIVFGGPSNFSAVGISPVSPGITVRTGAGGGTITDTVNKGTIWAQTPGRTLTVTGAWDNAQGTIRASSGSTLLLTGTATNAGMGNLVNEDGGTITFGATLDNTGQTFTFGGDKGTWNFNGRVTGGTVDLARATVIGSAQSGLWGNALLDNVKLASDLHVGDQSFPSVLSLTIQNGIDADGHTISAVNRGAGSGVLFLLNSSYTLQNANVSLGNATLSMFSQASATLTIGPSTTVSGWGAVTGNLPPAVSGVVYDNEGQIVANVKNQTLTVRPASIVNYGTMAATDGGVLAIAPVSIGFTWTNDGVLDAGAGSRITVGKDLVFADGSAYDVSFDPTGAFGQLQVTGMLDLSHLESLNLDVPPGTPPGTYTIATYTNGYRGAFDQVTPGYVVDYSTPGQIRVTVPEPAGGCMVMLAGVGLLARRRRQRLGQG